MADIEAFDEDLDEAGDGDFADEHDDVSVGDDGGPEDIDEEESPDGRAGMD